MKFLILCVLVTSLAAAPQNPDVARMLDILRRQFGLNLVAIERGKDQVPVLRQVRRSSGYGNQCPRGTVRNVAGECSEPIVERRVYVYSMPRDEETEIIKDSDISQTKNNQLDYNIVLINKLYDDDDFESNQVTTESTSEETESESNEVENSIPETPFTNVNQLNYPLSYRPGLFNLNNRGNRFRNTVHPNQNGFIYLVDEQAPQIQNHISNMLLQSQAQGVSNFQVGPLAFRNSPFHVRQRQRILAAKYENQLRNFLYTRQLRKLQELALASAGLNNPQITDTKPESVQQISHGEEIMTEMMDKEKQMASQITGIPSSVEPTSFSTDARKFEREISSFAEEPMLTKITGIPSSVEPKEITENVEEMTHNDKMMEKTEMDTKEGEALVMKDMMEETPETTLEDGNTATIDESVSTGDEGLVLGDSKPMKEALVDIATPITGFHSYLPVVDILKEKPIPSEKKPAKNSPKYKTSSLVTSKDKNNKGESFIKINISSIKDFPLVYVKLDPKKQNNKSKF